MSYFPLSRLKYADDGFGNLVHTGWNEFQWNLRQYVIELHQSY